MCLLIGTGSQVSDVVHGPLVILLLCELILMLVFPDLFDCKLVNVDCILIRWSDVYYNKKITVTYAKDNLIIMNQYPSM